MPPAVARPPAAQCIPYEAGRRERSAAMQPGTPARAAIALNGAFFNARRISQQDQQNAYHSSHAVE